MKVVEHPELKKIFRKLDILWYNRGIGVHKRDVENILIEAFENITNNNKEHPSCVCGGQMTHSHTIDGYNLYYCGCQLDIGILHSAIVFKPISPEEKEDK